MYVCTVTYFFERFHIEIYFVPTELGIYEKLFRHFPPCILC